MTKITEFDTQELLRGMFDLSDDVDDDAIEDLVNEKFDVPFESFHKIVEALIPFTVPAVTAVGGTTCQGFVKDGMFLVKVEKEA